MKSVVAWEQLRMSDRDVEVMYDRFGLKDGWVIVHADIRGHGSMEEFPSPSFRHQICNCCCISGAIAFKFATEFPSPELQTSDLQLCCISGAIAFKFATEFPSPELGSSPYLLLLCVSGEVPLPCSCLRPYTTFVGVQAQLVKQQISSDWWNKILAGPSVGDVSVLEHIVVKADGAATCSHHC
ncbi:hypothetical protein INR49_023603 [Caranx melampygus]|nr:hypothetical protein INR49_023603 [Caranx melampygus]